VHFYSISVTPEEDSPSRLSSYAETRKINLTNWDFLTGDHDTIYQLGRKVFRADRNPDGTTSESVFIHTRAIYLIDSELRIRGVYQSEKASDIETLVEDTKQLVQEKDFNT
jgi:protein SCO1/2